MGRKIKLDESRVYEIAEHAKWILDPEKGERLVWHHGSVTVAGQDLHGVDFRGAKLLGIDFTGCDLRGCNFDWATLEDCTFDNADLRGARMLHSWRQGCTFVRADLRTALFSLTSEMPDQHKRYFMASLSDDKESTTMSRTETQAMVAVAGITALQLAGAKKASDLCFELAERLLADSYPELLRSPAGQRIVRALAPIVLHYAITNWGGAIPGNQQILAACQAATTITVANEIEKLTEKLNFAQLSALGAKLLETVPAEVSDGQP